VGVVILCGRVNRQMVVLQHIAVYHDAGTYREAARASQDRRTQTLGRQRTADHARVAISWVASCHTLPSVQVSRSVASSCGISLSTKTGEQTHDQVLQCDKNARYRHHRDHRVLVRAFEQLVGQSSCCFVRILQSGVSLGLRLDLSDTLPNSCSGAWLVGDSD